MYTHYRTRQHCILRQMSMKVGWLEYNGLGQLYRGQRSEYLYQMTMITDTCSYVDRYMSKLCPTCTDM